MDGYNAWPGTDAGTDLALPQLVKNIYDSGQNVTYNSSIYIQNINSAASANVTVRYRVIYGGEYIHSGITISPNGSYAADLQTDTALDGLSTFYGGARITSTLPVVAVVHQNTPINLTIYSGFTSARSATTLYLAQVMKYINDSPTGFTWSTGIQVMSMDGTSANVTLTSRGTDGREYVETITAAPIACIDQRSSTVLPSGFYGTGKLTANKPIVAIVNANTNYDSNRGVRAGTYRAYPATLGATKVFLPLLRKNAVDPITGVLQSTGIAGQLVGSSATTVTLTYYLSDGTTLVRTTTASPSSPMINFDPRNDTGLPDGSVASGVLTTNPPQPIVINANISPGPNVLGDGFMYYDGIGQ